MQNRFVFYASFYEALKELPDKSRLRIYDAICNYALCEIEPQFSGVEKIVFSLIKPQISANLQRQKNGCLGGAPKNNQNARKVDLENNLKTTEKQPKNNQGCEERKTSPPIKESNKENIPSEKERIPPTPQGAGEIEGAKEVFFEKYPALKGRSVKDEGINYSLLLREFELSSMLQGLYSFPKVVSMYEAIERGDFRDKQNVNSNPAVEAANARSARERWYAERQAKAEAASYPYQKKANENKRFREIEKELGRLNMELAKAELEGSDMFLGLKEYQERLIEERGRILKQLGIKEEQLHPQYACEKCSDSGYLPDGRACDCYNKR